VEQVNSARAERIGDLLRRYMWARSRCVGGDPPPGPLSQLVSQLQWSPCEFDGVRVELNLEPPIVWDRDQPDFFNAMMERDSGRLPELEDLAQWRDYVHSNGPMPREPGLKFPSGARTGVDFHRDRIDVV